ncbi:monofunctional biosynthetic peptidoglycan transglycosylase [Plasticicumulans sp.]|uniref:monofunctional biosynthetic peptidoglycan transglycosylase n=1 Tax=Plasticicumulans sp. TaxID=2307179 RepID=UPI002BD80254|nr:monofunctional biosynthetic peptidoglycan transglycosylase [Plasticicumulans sp.]MBS0600752.1 monofunctional biosynthetic peptidoglycan transglycosylase [Pseudomonadota bacterium]HMV39118.1 monofunctional biosynthetic peptidoglycan transglycosylase [Plasticicumulans sp.]HMW28268.1 monofunctional biosynthetic peptidoglycan transglycosylase [Plasticicumulans sp.]HMX53483.1 monofunctional biosynthetic peptidoglycan transglycosylase [Plasticicumulans sp.]HMZ11337.1 monofunctional biosynthetic p
MSDHAPESGPRRRLRLRTLLLALPLAGLLLSLLLVLPLRWLAPVTSAFMIAVRLDDEAGRWPEYRWVPYEAISAQLALAVLAGEDQRFAEHHGFDTVEIERALSAADQGGKLRGASTISQQVAKNLFLWSGRSYVRKALEAWFTLLIEACWSKRRILEMHLNLAQYGPRTFGAEAAAQRFFGKPAWDLDAGEAARLAAVLPNPRLYRVEAPNATVRTRERHIRTQMRNLGGTGFLDRLSE